MKVESSEPSEFDYEVALSFAGEDRDYVEKVANYLEEQGVSVFYDQFEQTDLWGKDLYAHLADLYQNRSKYVVMFVSRHYAVKNWPKHERKSAQARAFRQDAEYILPARFDDTEIPGLHPTVGYVDLRRLTPIEFGRMIEKKLGRGEFWKKNAAQAASFSLNHLFSAHRGAILWSPKIVAVFANDNDMLQHRYFKTFRDHIGVDKIIAESYVDEKEGFALLVESSNAEELFEILWACFAAEYETSGDTNAASYADYQKGQAYVVLSSYFERPVHPRLSPA